MSYDIREINRLSRSSSYYGPSLSTSSSTTSTISSTTTTTSNATMPTLSISSSTPSSPMRNYSSNSSNNNNNNNLSHSSNQNSRNYTARDLIREFMAKNSSPPAILKPSYQPFEYSQDLALAYKHPQLLGVNEKVDQEDIELMSSSCSSNAINERYEQLMENAKLKMHNVTCLDSNANVGDIEKENFMVLKSELSNENSNGCNAYSSRNQKNKMIKNSNNNDNNGNLAQCKLVGNVADNIVKTWEQINSYYCSNENLDQYTEQQYPTTKRDLVFSRTISNHSDDNEQMIYYQQVDENKASFRVNKVIYSENEEPSDIFYDSIDNGLSEEQLISISQDGADVELTHAECYDRRKNQSLDSEMNLERNFSRNKWH